MAGVYHDDGSLRVTGSVAVSGTVTSTPQTGFTQAIVTLPANTSTRLANTNEVIYAVMNIGTGNLNINFNSAAVVDSGLSLNAASAQGRQGGALSFDTPVTMKFAMFGISAAGTTVAVLKG